MCQELGTKTKDHSMKPQKVILKGRVEVGVAGTYQLQAEAEEAGNQKIPEEMCRHLKGTSTTGQEIPENLLIFEQVQPVPFNSGYNRS